VGYVGKKCDTADACAKSNPCKSGSKCILDEKLKPVCKCPPGWSSKNCDKRNCTVVEFKGKNFVKTPKVYIDSTIVTQFENLDGLAKLCKVKVSPLRSFSLQVDPKATPDNLNAPFYIGHALQFDIADAEGKLLCNSVCLGKTPIPIAPAKCFVDGLNSFGFKYSILHPGVAHSNFHVTNSQIYSVYKEAKQTGCKETKF